MTDNKKYMFIDLSGRGIKSKLTDKHIRNTWDLSEISDNDQVLSDFLDNSDIGDTWETDSIKLITL